MEHAVDIVYISVLPATMVPRVFVHCDLRTIEYRGLEEGGGRRREAEGGRREREEGEKGGREGGREKERAKETW